MSARLAKLPHLAIVRARDMSIHHRKAEMMHGYEAWKAMGVGVTSYTWEGYMSAVNAGKTMAYGADETIIPGFYKEPQNVAAGWSKATELQKENALKSFFKTPLPERQGPRARAKPFVFPQRERNADELQDPDMKKAYLAMFDQLGPVNKKCTEWKISCLEKQGQALFIRPSIRSRLWLVPPKAKFATSTAPTSPVTSPCPSPMPKR